MATIQIKRDKDDTNYNREYLVELDNEIVGNIKLGETKSFKIQPGTHLLRMKIDWCSSNYRIFESKNGETVSFECGSNIGFNPFSFLLYVTFLKDEYLWLKKL